MADIESIIKRLSHLPQYKNCSKEELRKIAENKQAVNNLDIASLFTDVEDKKLAKEFLDKYLQDYNIETMADKNLLRQLIYLEVIQANHLQKTVNEFVSTSNIIPDKALESLHKNLNQIVSLKEKLGLTKDKAKELETDGFKALEILQKKAKVWRENNQASRTLVCPHCQKMTLLRIRMDAWEAQKHPFFKDRVLGNEELVRLYQDGLKFVDFIEKHRLHKLDVNINTLTCQDCNESITIPVVTKEKVAKVFETSQDYIDWLIAKWSLNLCNINNNI